MQRETIMYIVVTFHSVVCSEHFYYITLAMTVYCVQYFLPTQIAYGQKCVAGLRQVAQLWQRDRASHVSSRRFSEVRHFEAKFYVSRQCT